MPTEAEKKAAAKAKADEKAKADALKANQASAKKAAEADAKKKADAAKNRTADTRPATKVTEDLVDSEKSVTPEGLQAYKTRQDALIAEVRKRETGSASVKYPSTAGPK